MQNKFNSSTVQALLDIMSTGRFSNTKLLEDIISELESDASLRASADQRFNAHEYNERGLEFSQIPVLHKNTLALSGNALRLLVLVQGYMSKTNVAEINTKTACEVLGISEWIFTKAKQELIKAQAIVEIETAHRGASPIYAINPRYVHHSKRPDKLADSFWNAVRDKQERDLSKHTDSRPEWDPEAKDSASKEKIAYKAGVKRINGRSIGLLEKNEPADAATSEDSSTVKITNSAKTTISQTRSKRKQKTTEDDQIPGQMSLLDFPEVLPKNTTEDLPF